ncbi:MAG: glycine--tRNA ligase subunit beta, partial [Epsilonproteobacteria bacterium]|nr:glycine--tRNA ligase subunit beta [Campylobacterota bacterium]
IDLNSNLRVDEKLFEKEEERVLYKKFLEIKSKKFSSYEEKLNALFSLKDDLEKFFDNVMVNVDDKSIRENRLNLIGSIYKEFRSIADIKEISI